MDAARDAYRRHSRFQDPEVGFILELTLIMEHTTENLIQFYLWEIQ